MFYCFLLFGLLSALCSAAVDPKQEKTSHDASSLYERNAEVAWPEEKGEHARERAAEALFKRAVGTKATIKLISGTAFIAEIYMWKGTKGIFAGKMGAFRSKTLEWPKQSYGLFGILVRGFFRFTTITLKASGTYGTTLKMWGAANTPRWSHGKNITICAVNKATWSPPRFEGC